jgi:hypothetical protein
LSSTSASLVRNNEGLSPPGQAYSSTDSAWKIVNGRRIGSSEYGTEFVSYVLTSSSALIARASDTGGRAKRLSGGEQTTVAVTVSTATDGLSGNVDLGVFRYGALYMSTAWTAANITFAVADVSTGTYLPLYDDQGNEVTILNTSASRMISLDSVLPSLFPLRHLKVRSGTLGTPVTQAASRALSLVL